MPRKAATARGRTLGAELRLLRKHLGLSTRAAAERIGWTAATLNRTENGLRVATAEEVAAVLGAYGVVSGERERLLALARDAEMPGWWEPGDSIYPTPLKALIGFEAQAVRITNVEISLVPGLLQIPEYARAIMAASGIPPLEIETRVATRMGRQAILSRPQPPKLLALIDEAALRRPVGGRHTVIEQLRHLQRQVRRPNIEVRVIPLEVGAHPALAGPFTILEFDRANTLVYQSSKRASIFVDAVSEVAEFVACVDTLKAASLPPDRSNALIAKIIAFYGS
ncbi:helix-turn-helix domain-containing protein [Actinomadura rupiterrae]|uniref:helix-turn-helix domain-containing protein n=1 Tax=Actinomadura rupiterrae TaxID=559627 RepID=UPI0020A42D26|nr:helix-turn-helix transcriptional regulator [Actinomadura rupiterrae]MCP2341963.1 transcriptional regulator with XRE-family HTH domain [Actinomadura rupiterrae]